MQNTGSSAAYIGYPQPQDTQLPPPHNTGYPTRHNNNTNAPSQSIGSAPPQNTGFPPPHNIGWPRAAANVALPNPSTPVFAPSANAGRHVAMAYATAASPNPNAPALHVLTAVPVGLPAPSDSMLYGVANFEPPPASKMPLIVLAIACVLSGALAALVLF